MRGVLLSLAVAFVLAAATPAHSTATALSAGPNVSASTAIYALQLPDKKIEVTVGERTGGGGAWYRSPVWIAIGAIAIVVVLLLIVLVARGGGGTTIVKE